jgi:AAA15 family ATPase/GTPase
VGNSQGKPPAAPIGRGHARGHGHELIYPPERVQNKDTNPKGAQLIFCSHETYLLSNLVGLRQDQIWFAEKNAQEETVLRSLLEYNMRSDSEFEKNYRQGRFGAVPVIWS